MLGLNCQNKPNGFCSCCVLRGGAEILHYIHYIYSPILRRSRSFAAFVTRVHDKRRERPGPPENQATIHYRSWSSKGVKNVGHLMKDTTNFLSLLDFTERLNIKKKLSYFIPRGDISD